MRASRPSQKPRRLSAIPRRSTLLDLVQQQLRCDPTASERDVVERAIHLVNSGRVVLTGSFAGQRLRPC